MIIGYMPMGTKETARREGVRAKMLLYIIWYAFCSLSISTVCLRLTVPVVKTRSSKTAMDAVTRTKRDFTMHTLMYISQFFGFIALITFIWLVIRAFRRSMLWGFGVLFLSPIVSTFYGIKYWNEDKKPFLAYTMTYCISISLALYVFASWGGFRVMNAAINVGDGITQQNLTEQEARKFMSANLDFLEKAAETEEDRQNIAFMRKTMKQIEDEATAPGTNATPTPKNKATRHPPRQEDISPDRDTQFSLGPTGDTRYRVVFKPIKLSDVRNYLNGPVIVTDVRGITRKATLIVANKNKLTFAQLKSYGRLSFDIPLNRIKILKAPHQVPYYSKNGDPNKTNKASLD